jgi:ATP-dependent protease ClpP protease subunit
MQETGVKPVQGNTVQAPGINIARGKAAYVSFSAEINASTTEPLIQTLANFANVGVAEVRLLLSTSGGSVMNGVNLYNMLKALPLKLVTHNVGNVDSIGNAIFLAGEERYACPHSTFMFHGVAAGFQPPVAALPGRQLRECLANVDADERRIAAIVGQHTKLSEDKIRAFFRDAHTMDATEAVSTGIVHEIKEVQIPPGSPTVQLVFNR